MLTVAAWCRFDTSPSRPPPVACAGRIACDGGQRVRAMLAVVVFHAIA